MSLGRQIVVFGLSSAASRLAAILLVPLYTRTLSILEYGQLEVMLALYALFVIVVGLQGESAVARDFFEARTAGTQSLLSAGSLVMAAAGTGLLAVIMACGVALDWWPDGVAQALPLLLAMALATQILGVQLVILRFAGAPLFFATVSFLDLFIAASTSVVMIVVLHWGITGALAGILVGKTVCIALAWSRSFGWSVRHGTTRTTLSAMTRYALPTMPAVLLNWLQTNGNRVLLAAFLAFQDVALAGIALKVAALYGFLTYAFRLAWEPYSFERLGSFDDDRQIFNRALQVYVVAMFAIAGAATIASPLLMAMLAPPVYASATKLSGLFILGQFWIGAVPILAIGVHGARVTSPPDLCLRHRRDRERRGHCRAGPYDRGGGRGCRLPRQRDHNRAGHGLLQQPPLRDRLRPRDAGMGGRGDGGVRRGELRPPGHVRHRDSRGLDHRGDLGRAGRGADGPDCGAGPVRRRPPHSRPGFVRHCASAVREGSGSMIFIVVMVFVIASAFAVISNPDIFSPAKIILFFFLMFHLGALMQETTTTTGMLILLVLVMATLSLAVEAGHAGRRVKAPPPVADAVTLRKDFALWFWVMSIPGVLAQIYMIAYFGGLEGYSASIAFRVVEWSGFGWARVLIALLTTINLVYFAVGLNQRRTRVWWVGYAMHLFIILFIAILSGSRSSLLNVFVMQMIIFHYVRARVRPAQAITTAGLLIFAATLLEIARKTARYTGGQLTIGASRTGSVVGFDSFYYGVLPLEIITRTEHLPLAHGSTFLSLFTNAIPRALWPDKPDTGGVFFTRFYAGDAWGGYSNLTPTFVGEWIINFGWLIGVIGFFVSYGTLLLLLNRYYRSIVNRMNATIVDTRAVDVVIYAHVLLAVVGLMVGELTNVVLTLVTSQLVPLAAIRWFVAWRSKA